ncbi:2,3-bisphosphoglycerate-dependent phosphoglycerate mutase [Candidatus Woesearchaeota archaeon]|nr:2,3-bisphosphoglycerate-dependent phosphoglycerate mutase [Candidatus Woesearchaeota archaeon]MCF8013848.1 2,3-bisphosphoglycerate-dependent phosphoglycerate mutase [Candidatus Woesearchaeota archaeon]
MKLKIYLFRHGQTYFNKNHVFTGHKNSKLTEQGYKDAKEIANALKNKKINIAFHSHLTRSKQTLKEILKYHPECKKIIEDDKIIERDYGELSGIPHKKLLQKKGEEIYKTLVKSKTIQKMTGFDKAHAIEMFGQDYRQIMRRSYKAPPPKGESIQDVEKRVNSFIKNLIKLMKKEKVNVAISAHGNSMRPFRKYFEKLSIKEMMKLENPWDKHFEYTINVPDENKSSKTKQSSEKN